MKFQFQLFTSTCGNLISLADGIPIILLVIPTPGNLNSSSLPQQGKNRIKIGSDPLRLPLSPPNLRQPTLEHFRPGRGDGLDNPKNTFEGDAIGPLPRAIGRREFQALAQCPNLAPLLLKTPHELPPAGTAISAVHQHAAEQIRNPWVSTEKNQWSSNLGSFPGRKYVDLTESANPSAQSN